MTITYEPSPDGRPGTVTSRSLTNSELADGITNILKVQHPDGVTDEQSFVANVLISELNWELLLPDGAPGEYTTGPEAFVRLAKLHPGSFRSDLLKKLNNASYHRPERVSAILEEFNKINDDAEVQEIEPTKPLVLAPTPEEVINIETVISEVEPQVLEGELPPAPDMTWRTLAENLLTDLLSSDVIERIGNIDRSTWTEIVNHSSFKNFEESAREIIPENYKRMLSLDTPESAIKALQYANYVNVSASVNPDVDTTNLLRGLSVEDMKSFRELLTEYGLL